MTVGSNTVERQRMVVADPTTAANLATVSAAGALKVDNSGNTQPVSGAVTLAKRTQILTTSLLTSSATFTSAWQDTSTTGTSFVAISLFSTNVAIAFGNFTIQETDDTANASMTRIVYTGSSVAAAVSQITGQIKSRYWRVVVVNGATAMTGTFEVTATESNATQQVSMVDPASNTPIGTVGNQFDGVTVFSSGFVSSAFGYGFNGTSWDRLRTSGTGLLKVDNSGVTQPVSAGAATATTGSITTSSTAVSAAVNGYSHVGVSISGTYAGVNIAFEFSDDGGTLWYAMQMVRSDSSIVESTSGVLANTNRVWDVSVPSCTHFRVRATAWTSGSATIRIIPSSFPAVYNIAGNLRITDATATNFLPTADSAARALYSRVTDGTNQAAVKAASTAAVAGDPALVVSVSPNTPVSIAPSITGGLTFFKLISAASTNTGFAKSSAGQLYGIQAFNINATAVRWLKLYNKATAPTIGTDVPVKTILIPANGSGVIIEITQGLAFSNGIAFAITAGITDADAVAIAASEVVINLDFK